MKFKMLVALILVAGIATMSYAKSHFITPGARAGGYGTAFSAVADDLTAIYYNPAGLAYQTNTQVMASLFYIDYPATASDKNANVIGTGNIKLTDGVNNVSITVVAENGNERVYTITVNVKDTDPIKVKVGKKEYTVVKKVEQLTAPDNFSPIEADIAGKKVPALYNEITGYILIGLKDDKGNVKLYVYDPKSKKYTLYHEITSSSIKLYYTKVSNVPKGLKKTKIDINGERVTAYKSNKKSDFYLVYGMNVNTGDIGWYRYDASDKTLQRYETRDLENLSMLNNKYLITIAVLSTSILMLMLFLLILFSRLKHMK